MSNPLIEGSISSPDLSPQQLELATFVEYFAKIATYVAVEEVTVKVDQPEGLQRFLKEKDRLEKTQKRVLTKDEIEKLEKEVRYDIRRIPVGNSSTILGRLLMEGFTSDKVRKAIDATIDDALNIARKKAMNTKATKSIAESELI